MVALFSLWVPIFIIISIHSANAMVTFASNKVNPSVTTTALSSHLSTTGTAGTSIDWGKYKLQQSYDKAGGIFYKQSVLTPHEFTIIAEELNHLINEKLKLENEKSSSFATNRIGAQVSPETEIYRVLSNEEGGLCQLINCLSRVDKIDVPYTLGDVAGDGEGDDMKNEEGDQFGRMVLAPDIPIEVRYWNYLFIFIIRHCAFLICILSKTFRISCNKYET